MLANKCLLLLIKHKKINMFYIRIIIKIKLVVEANNKIRIYQMDIHAVHRAHFKWQGTNRYKIGANLNFILLRLILIMKSITKKMKKKKLRKIINSIIRSMDIRIIQLINIMQRQLPQPQWVPIWKKKMKMKNLKIKFHKILNRRH